MVFTGVQGGKQESDYNNSIFIQSIFFYNYWIKLGKLVWQSVQPISRRFYPKRLTSVYEHIDTPTAESTMQGDIQQLGLSVLLRDTSKLS